MGIIKAARSVFALAATLFLLTLIFIIGFTTLQPFFVDDPVAPGDTIVVLGGGMDADGTLHQSTVIRVEKGVSLFAQGIAPHIHFTGGVAAGGTMSAGAQMAILAQSLGVPTTAITHEDLSQSTLQNALFSREHLSNSKRIILVTEGFHLARSWVSMQLFGDYDIALVGANRFRASTAEKPLAPIKMTIRETLAVWFNLGRYIVWRGAAAFEIPLKTRDAILY